MLDKLDVVFLQKRREVLLDIFVEDSFQVSKLLDCRTVVILDLVGDTDIFRLISSNIAFISEESLYLPFIDTIIENIRKPVTLRKEYADNQQCVLINILLSRDPVIVPGKLVDSLGLSIASVYRTLSISVI